MLGTLTYIDISSSRLSPYFSTGLYLQKSPSQGLTHSPLKTTPHFPFLSFLLSYLLNGILTQSSPLARAGFTTVTQMDVVSLLKKLQHSGEQALRVQDRTLLGKDPEFIEEKYQRHYCRALGTMGNFPDTTEATLQESSPLHHPHLVSLILTWSPLPNHSYPVQGYPFPLNSDTPSSFTLGSSSLLT